VAAIVRIVLYVRDIPKVAHFYERHFGMSPVPSVEKGWLELKGGGCDIALHQASSAQKSGAAMKIVFGVRDVRGFMAERAAEGLKFGSIHEVRDGVGNAFEFANAKDPAGNSIQISSRGLQSTAFC
jgi:catechol 2,3-dioxygenase-like lactoylglutathione lyase family enzyme